MNFDHRRQLDEPEINLIPLIDVLLVILIFLAASTAFTHTRQLPIALPYAHGEALEDAPALDLAISRDGLYALDGRYVDSSETGALAAALQQAAGGRSALALNIDADAQTPHAAVVRALEAARVARITRVHFLTQARP